MWSGGFERGGECSVGRVWPLGIDEPLGQDFGVRSSDCRQLSGDLTRFQVHFVKTFANSLLQSYVNDSEYRKSNKTARGP